MRNVCVTVPLGVAVLLLAANCVRGRSLSPNELKGSITAAAWPAHPSAAPSLVEGFHGHHPRQREGSPLDADRPYGPGHIIAKRASSLDQEAPRPVGGPVWPLTFQATFEEVLYTDAGVMATNKGTWYYDFAHKRARFDHLKGQANNFCSGQGLSDDEPDAPCRLIFAPGSEMYVHYPRAGTCCQLCKAGIGCSPLLPNWIADGELVGEEAIGGSTCQQFFKRGAVADDFWFQTEAGVPCRYFESLSFPGHATFYHNLTFNQDSYSTDAPPDSLFNVPSYCHKMCPKPFPSGG